MKSKRRTAAPIEPWRLAIQRHRDDRGWTQAELGRRAKPAKPISHTTISNIENGHTDPQISTLQAIAEALGLSVADILADEPRSDLMPATRILRKHLLAEVGREVHKTFEQLISEVVDAWHRMQREHET